MFRKYRVNWKKNKGEEIMHGYERHKMIALLYRIFQCEEWRWQNKIPTYEEVAKTVEELEYDAYKEKGVVESGRIRVEYDKEIDMYNYYLVL